MSTGKVTPLPEARFAPLPPTNQHQGERIDWDALTAPLRQRPGEWAAIATIPALSSLGARAGKLRARSIETTQRSNGDGTATIWARYTGATHQQDDERADATHVLHTFDFRRPNLPPPLVWAPPSEVAS